MLFPAFIPFSIQLQELLSDFKDALNTAENDSKIRGLVLTSACQSVFSAGLDLAELYKADRERFTVFWTTFQVCLTKNNSNIGSHTP